MSDILKNIIFPCGPEAGNASAWILLALRLIFGTLLLVHGTQKMMDYNTLATSFPDPIGLGSRLSLQLAIFAEFFCSIGVITGLFFRLALIPMIVTMCVAAFFALKDAPWLQRELPISYLLVYLLLMITGPGKFSLDRLICRWFGW